MSYRTKANSESPDQTPQNAASDQGPHFFAYNTFCLNAINNDLKTHLTTRNWTWTCPAHCNRQYIQLKGLIRYFELSRFVLSIVNCMT